jgi:hypothetical protein
VTTAATNDQQLVLDNAASMFTSFLDGLLATRCDEALVTDRTCGSPSSVDVVL